PRPGRYRTNTTGPDEPHNQCVAGYARRRRDRHRGLQHRRPATPRPRLTRRTLRLCVGHRPGCRYSRCRPAVYLRSLFHHQRRWPGDGSGAIDRLWHCPGPWWMDRRVQPTRAGHAHGCLCAHGGGAMSGRILIVEDDRSMGEMLEADLQLRGFTTVWCPTAEAALAQWQHDDFDVVLTDLKLPGLHGLD